MTGFLIGGLVITGAVLLTIVATGMVAGYCFRLGREAGRDEADTERRHGEGDLSTVRKPPRLRSGEDAADITSTLVPLRDDYLFTHGDTGTSCPDDMELGERESVVVDSNTERTADAADRGGNQ